MIRTVYEKDLGWLPIGEANSSPRRTAVSIAKSYSTTVIVMIKLREVES